MQIGSESEIDHCPGVNHGWGLAGSGQFLVLEGVVFGSHQGMPCQQGLPSESRQAGKKEPPGKFELKMEQLRSFSTKKSSMYVWVKPRQAHG